MAKFWTIIYFFFQFSDWDSDDLTAQALFFFFAGFETSSTMLCHMSNELAMNPDIQKRLQEEIDRTLKHCDGKITYEALVKMKYLDMVLSGKNFFTKLYITCA